jgi:hypothetical protein
MNQGVHALVSNWNVLEYVLTTIFVVLFSVQCVFLCHLVFLKSLWESPTMQTDYSRRYQKVGGIYALRIIKIFRRRYPTSSSS